MSDKANNSIHDVIVAIREDEALRIAYVANIAMAFYDTVRRAGRDYPELHEDANRAAEYFMELWLSPTTQA